MTDEGAMMDAADAEAPARVEAPNGSERSRDPSFIPPAPARVPPEGLLPQDERETLRRDEPLAQDTFSTREADTLTAHSVVEDAGPEDGSTATLRRDDASLVRGELGSVSNPDKNGIPAGHMPEESRRRDTMPAPPVGLSPSRDASPSSGGTLVLDAAPVGPPSLLAGPSPALAPMPPPAREVVAVPPLPTRLGTPRLASPMPKGVTKEEDASFLDDDDLIEVDDDTTASLYRAQSNDDPTSPTMSLANRSASSREVYRLFLASEYAPALALADELIAQGDTDPMLITIARECRAAQRAAVTSTDEWPGFLSRQVTGQTTLEQLAQISGMSVGEMLQILERFVVANAGQPR